MREKYLSTYPGVTRGNIRDEKQWWKGQICVGSKTFYLGEFETQQEAARAYDNCVHALRKAGRTRTVKLNFPDEWDTGDKSNPSYTEVTDKVVSAFLASNQVERAPSFQFVP